MAELTLPATRSTPLSRRRLWPVLLLLVASRLVLNVPAELGANLGRLQGGAVAVNGVGADPRLFPGIWARWDSGFYLTIASSGYAPGAKELAFFPGYPVLLRLLSLGQQGLMTGVGYLISNVAFVLAGLLLWQLVEQEHSAGVAWATIATLAVFPTSLFLSAVYAESLFILMAVLTYWFAVRRQYGLAALCVALASVTRITGFLLVLIPLTEQWLNRPPQAPRLASFWARLALTAALAALGLGGLCLYFWVTQAAPLAFLGAQQEYWLRTVVWPWQTVVDSARVVAIGYGGNETNWFMRATSAQDLLVTLLFTASTVLVGLWLRRSLFLYQLAGLLFMLVSHGPYAYGLWSMSRITLTLFPGFIAMGLLLQRLPRLKWLVWAGSYALQLFLTAWFANGRWVA